MDGEGGEKKEVRRPMNAFLIFCKRHRSVVREKNPDMDNRSVTRVLGDLWANLGEEKATYTNLAKQYKDAFMKANPNYKWHSSDKSSSSKVTGSKPTNSRVIKKVTELSGDGCITPGKLADPEKMGGLNLLLMADKETRDVRSSSSLSMVMTSSSSPLSTAASVSLATSTTTASFATSAAQANTCERTGTPNSALLQLAEMCTSELEISTKDMVTATAQTHPQHSRLQHSILYTGISSTHPAPSPCHQPMPPPKKRAHHWSLTERDDTGDSPNYEDSKDCFGISVGNRCNNVSLSPLNLTVPKIGSISVEFGEGHDPYKPAPVRRRLSSSATESIPSPAAPYVDGLDDLDSPVFAQDYSKSESYACSSLRSENQDVFDKKTFSASAKHSSKNHGFLLEQTHLEKQPSSVSAWLTQPQQIISATLQQQQSPLSPHYPLQKSDSISPLSCLQASSSFVATGQKDFTSSDPSLPMAGQSNVTSSLHGTVIRERSQTWSSLELKGDNPDFYQWREPSKSKSKLEETSQTSLKLTVSSAEGMTSTILSKLNHSVSSASELSTTKPASASSTVDFTSLLSEGRIASLLSSPDTPPPKLSRDVPLARCSLSERSEENREAVWNAEGLTANEKVTELEALPVKPPSASQPHTFSQTKLKKKWAQRSLVDAKMQEDLIQQQQGRDDTGNSSVLTVASSSNAGAQLMRDSPSSHRNSFFADLKWEDISRQASSSEVRTAPVRNTYQTVDSKLFSPVESSTQNWAQKQLILNQPLELFKASVEQSHSSLTFSDSTSSHVKMGPKTGQLKAESHQYESLFGRVTVKSEDMGPNWNKSAVVGGKSSLEGSTLGKAKRSDCKPSIYLNTSINKGSDLGLNNNTRTLASCLKNNNGTVAASLKDKHILNQITACGKKFVDHIVEQLFKSDFSGEKVAECNRLSSPIKVQAPACKQERMDLWVKQEEDEDYRVPSASCLVEKVVREVCGSPPQKRGCNSCRKLDQQGKNEPQPLTKERDASHHLLEETATQATVTSSQLGQTESPGGLEMYGLKSSSPSNDADNQCQRSALTPESCEQSDHNDDSSVQPVRKSRRANRGQKYQELIKEGFIQPSRERMAARNADRQQGRSFGTREEYEKLESKRILKRSASERDAPSDLPVLFSNNMDVSFEGTDTDKRYTTGDFDLEKEIESLPVCSLDQLGRKKSLRRRCDSESLSTAPRHRSNSDATSLSSSTSLGSSTAHKFSSATMSLASSTVEVTLQEPGCPAPHIPIPKEERPTEPITGSRKRKARKHCITRISVVEEHKITDQGETTVPLQHKTSNQSPESLSQIIPPVRNCATLKDTRDTTGENQKTSSLSPAKVESHKEETKLVQTINRSSSDSLVTSSPSLSVTQPSRSTYVLFQGDALQPQQITGNSTHLLQTAFNSIHVAQEMTNMQKASTLLPPITTKPQSSCLALEKMVSSMKCLQRDHFPVSSSAGEVLGTVVPDQNCSGVGSTITSPSAVNSVLRVSVIPDMKLITSVVMSHSRPVGKQSSANLEAESSSGPGGKHCPMGSTPKQHKAKSTRTKGMQDTESDIPKKKLKNVMKTTEEKKISGQKTEVMKTLQSLSPQKLLPEPRLSPLVCRLFSSLPGSSDSLKTTMSEKTGPASRVTEAVLMPSHVMTVNLNDLTAKSTCGTLPHTPSPKPVLVSAASNIKTMPESRSTSLPKPPQCQSYFNKAALTEDSAVIQSCRSDIWSSKSVPYTCETTLSSQIPASFPSYSNIPTITTTLPSSTALLPLSQCPMSSSSSSSSITTSAVSSTQSTSSSSDIVSYTVIGSSSVMEAGSPHMIGSPHLPESPSVAVVQS